MFSQISKTDVIYISFETLKPPLGIAAFIKTRRKDAATIQKEISSAVSTNKREVPWQYLEKVSFELIMLKVP